MPLPHPFTLFTTTLLRVRNQTLDFEALRDTIMPDDLSLTSTFHGSDKEWWERAARNVLQFSNEYNNVRLVCRYLYPDKNIPCELLSKRSGPWLAGFLDFLHELNSSPHCSSAATVKNIVDLCYSQTTFDPHWDGKSITSGIDSLLEPHQIAEKIDSDIRTVFNQIPYTTWVWLALGYEDVAIRNILHQISGICSNLSRKYQEIFGPNEQEEAELVMNAFQSRHPMAYWILSASFIHYDLLIKPRDGLQLLLDPIFEIFAKPDRNVLLLVRRLDILSLRFQREFIHAPDINWSKDLSTDFSFLDNLERNSPKTIAKSLTETDCRSLRLHVYDIFQPNQPNLNLIDQQWNGLCYEVADCIIVDRGYLNSIVEIIEYLLEWRNYYSATSLIIGLQNAKVSFNKFPEFQELIDLESNYGNFRKMQSECPGLPFMFPLIKELRFKQKASSVPLQKVADMFPFSSWISNVQCRANQAELNYSFAQALNLGPENEGSTMEGSPTGIIVHQPQKIAVIEKEKSAGSYREVSYSQSPQTTDQDSQTFWLVLLDSWCISRRC
ncbi:hypothetical protein OCU04_004411 [Sclerotinia nivalis]|uniref:Ras-GEF domain-containing protein n=1 Tax=Sclerotinia nivalis TaxID=352851 RepID=A0A9X0AQF5_9HELO|nr:hypothetical protein OCU04_004411 [Sclerotinia nivalis]